MQENFTNIHDFVKETQTLYSWKAPMRAYKKQGKRVLRFFLAVALLLSVIIIFFSDPIILLPLWAVLFLFYVITITPPPIIENKITKFGLESAGVALRWDTLDHFYFTQRWGFEILTIVSKPPYSLHAFFVIPDSIVKQRVATLMGEHILFVAHPRRTVTDRLIDMLSKLVPDEEEEPAQQKPASKPNLTAA